jgi:glutathione S-transferase
VRLDFSKGENTSAPYRKLNPSGKVPTLVDGDFVLTESMAICFYLCGLSDRATLIPARDREAALFYQRLFFGVTEVEPYLWLADKERFIRNEDLPPGVADYSIRKVGEASATIRRWLESSPYIAGSAFSLADVLYYHLITWSALYNDALSRVATDYLRRLEARPGFPQTMATAGSPTGAA